MSVNEASLSGDGAGPIVERGAAGLGVFERWLSLWVALCIILGIGFGHGSQGCSRRSAAPRSLR